MPRISNIYSIPPGTEGFPDTTIESEKYNNYIHDVETDLNLPRPISAGGTGANNADAAVANLGAEKSAQAVSNYDNHIFYPGSFYSASGATAGPIDGHAFAGIVYINEPLANPPTNNNVVVSARDMNDTVVPGRVYVRQKKANSWGPWTVIDASTLPFPPGGGLTSDTVLEAIQELDTNKVSKAGDTMTGQLTLPAGPAAANAVRKDYVDAADSGKVSKTGDSMSGGLAINAGGLSVTGANSINGNTSVTGGLTVTQAINFNGDAGLQSSSAGIVLGTTTGGFAYRPYGVGNPTNQFQMFPAGYMILNGDSAYYGTANGVNGGFGTKLGTNNTANGNYFNIWHEGSNGLQYLCINNTQMGILAYTSDYRIKKDVTPLPSMWDTVKSLKPISYTHQNFTPPSETDRSKEAQQPFMTGDDKERWGFIAHEVQEATIATASSAAKDAPNAIQDLNLAPIVAALTKCIQEAMARIEQLEART